MGHTHLRKPVVRRYGKLVIRLNAEGVAVKGFRRRTWYSVTYAELALLAMKKTPPAGGLSERQWSDVLKTMGAK